MAETKGFELIKLYPNNYKGLASICGPLFCSDQDVPQLHPPKSMRPPGMDSPITSTLMTDFNFRPQKC